MAMPRGATQHDEKRQKKWVGAKKCSFLSVPKGLRTDPSNCKAKLHFSASQVNYLDWTAVFLASRGRKKPGRKKKVGSRKREFLNRKTFSSPFPNSWESFPSFLWLVLSLLLRSPNLLFPRDLATPPPLSAKTYLTGWLSQNFSVCISKGQNFVKLWSTPSRISIPTKMPRHFCRFCSETTAKWNHKSSFGTNFDLEKLSGGTFQPFPTFLHPFHMQRSGSQSGPLWSWHWQPWITLKKWTCGKKNLQTQPFCKNFETHPLAFSNTIQGLKVPKIKYHLLPFYSVTSAIFL